MPTEKANAILTLKAINNMTPEARKQIADWLRRQAKALLKDGDDYAPTFRARFIWAKGS